LNALLKSKRTQKSAFFIARRNNKRFAQPLFTTQTSKKPIGLMGFAEFALLISVMPD
jgi:hypothetical protein